MKTSKKKTKSYSFYILFTGEGKNVKEAFKDAMDFDISQIPTPEVQSNAHVPVVIMDNLNECGICAIENEEDA